MLNLHVVVVVPHYILFIINFPLRNKNNVNKIPKMVFQKQFIGKYKHLPLPLFYGWE